MVERVRVPATRTGGRWTRPAVTGGHGTGPRGLCGSSPTSDDAVEVVACGHRLKSIRAWADDGVPFTETNR